jgi:hypothetical protein
MRICVTIDSNSPVIDRIFLYCQLNDIAMFPGPYIYVGESYWTWRIEAEPSAELTWLLLCYSDYLTVF